MSHCQKSKWSFSFRIKYCLTSILSKISLSEITGHVRIFPPCQNQKLLNAYGIFFKKNLIRTPHFKTVLTMHVQTWPYATEKRRNNFFDIHKYEKNKTESVISFEVLLIKDSSSVSDQQVFRAITSVYEFCGLKKIIGHHENFMFGHAENQD